MSFKEKVFASCLSHLEIRRHQLESALLDLTSDAENDSKSSAGDKHETGRAMMQLEHEKISRQLDETLKQQNELSKININISMQLVNKGSLIKTDRGYFFLSVAIGKLMVDGENVIVLSPQSPLGLKLVGARTGDTAEVNGMKYLIAEVA